MRVSMMQLSPHLDHPLPQVERLTVEAREDDGVLSLRYRLRGDLEALNLPAFTAPRREDRLWRSTCFEIFLRHNATAYREYNFAPDGRWSAYRFASYRHARSNLANQVRIAAGRDGEDYVLSAILIGQPIVGHRVGLSAIVEATDGTKGYFALAHPPGAADFHHDDCFAILGEEI